MAAVSFWAGRAALASLSYELNVMPGEPTYAARLSDLILADKARLRLLGHVAALGLPDCWVGGGFIRSAVWDHLHGREPDVVSGDIDVIWFDANRMLPWADIEAEERLRQMEPSANWSVKNQARMHIRNGDPPYLSAEDAVSRWCETATAVAARLNGSAVEIIAPHGLDDLFSMIVRPTPAFTGKKLPVFVARLEDKRWLERWPLLALAEF